MGNLFNRNLNTDNKYFKKYQTTLQQGSKYEDLSIFKNNQYQFERIDTYEGLFNTQQLLDVIDFDKFQNHCFFDSAVSKVEYTFNKIFDEFPVDGTEAEFKQFFLNLDGFGKHIYKKFDKNLGYLKFNNSFIEVQNKSGYLTSFNRNLNILSKLTKPILNPAQSEFSFDFRLFLDDTGSATNQVIFQYLDNSNNKLNGFTLFIKDFEIKNSIKFANLVFLLSNRSDLAASPTYAYIKFQVPLNKWNHICIVLSNLIDNNKQLNVYIDNFLQSNVNKSSNILSNDTLTISDSVNFIIGKGYASHNIAGQPLYSLNTLNNFKGFIDEFRYYHFELTETELARTKNENIYANDLLKLYFKFNEPTGIYEKNMLCFDSSGNSLHSRIQLEPPLQGTRSVLDIRTLISNLRYNPLSNDPKPSLLFEKDDYNPCLMPTYTLNKTLNQNYLDEAKEYDNFNPNLIFKLFPKHYFKEGALFEGLEESVYNQTAKTYYINESNQDQQDTDSFNYPGQQKYEGAQTFAKLLIIWARFFDEIKIYLDVLPKLIDISYSSNIKNDEAFFNDQTVNFFIPLMAKLNGFEFKELLKSVKSDQMLDGYIIGADGVDKSEYTIRYVQNEIWKRILINSKDMITAKGTKNAIRSVFNSVGISPDEYYIFREHGKSSEKFITHSLIKRVRDFKMLTFNKQYNVSLNIADFNTGLITINNLLNHNSNNFCLEFILNYNNILTNFENICSVYNQTANNIEFKLIYQRQNLKDVGDLILNLYTSTAVIYEIKIADINIFENLNYINISIENDLNDKIITLNYFNNTLNKIKKSQIRISQNTLNTANICPLIFKANNPVHIKKIKFENTNSQFNGNIMSLRLWKDLLTDNDMIDHLLNPLSIANERYQTNLNQRFSDFLYFDLNLQDNNNIFYDNINRFILPIDYSENEKINNLQLNSYPFKIISNSLTEFPYINKTLIVHENNLKFDESNIDNKITAAGYFDDELATLYNTEISPVYEKNYFNTQRNDVRFSIEMLNTKHLNEDIGKLFNSIDFFADIISAFHNQNEISYNQFEKFSDFYFKRLRNDKLQMTPLYELYQILDNVLSELLQDFISSRVKFNNNIYVIESHSFERHKFNYKFLESHVVMKGDYDQNLRSNTRKSYNYLNLEGRKL